MSRIRTYVDGKPAWQDLGPGYARLSWTQRGSVGGSYAAPERKPEGGHTPESYKRGIETKRLRGSLLAPGEKA